jgi:hypothetical protein
LAVHHEAAVPQVVGAAEGIAFGDTPSQRVVAEVLAAAEGVGSGGVLVI